MADATNYLSGRVIIKYGTNALTMTDNDGNVLGLQTDRIAGIAKIVKMLHDAGVDPILVSSGAVAAGMVKNSLVQRPTSTLHLQCLAAEGQYSLMSLYEKALVPYGIGVYQLLVTHSNFRTKKERTNLLEVVEEAFRNRKLPIFNTNDPVTNAELTPRNSKYAFTDNDPLATFVGIYCMANSVLLVTEPGNLGSGRGDSKAKALEMAEARGIKTWVGTHSELEKLVVRELKLKES